MQCFRSAWNRYYARAPQHGIFGLDKEADIRSVESLTKAFMGRVLSEENSERIALILHYAYGVTAGAAYGTLSGTVVWIFGDEVPITLLKISDPFERNARSHGSALVAHLIFGIVAELTLCAQRTIFID